MREMVKMAPYNGTRSTGLISSRCSLGLAGKYIDTWEIQQLRHSPGRTENPNAWVAVS